MEQLTPTEKKANELVNKIYQPLGYLKYNASSGEMWQYASDRAIEHVDEILKVYEYVDEYIIKRKEEFRPLEEYDYWQQVKEQIILNK